MAVFWSFIVPLVLCVLAFLAGVWLTRSRLNTTIRDLRAQLAERHAPISEPARTESVRSQPARSQSAVEPAVEPAGATTVVVVEEAPVPAVAEEAGTPGEAVARVEAAAPEVEEVARVEAESRTASQAEPTPTAVAETAVAEVVGTEEPVAAPQAESAPESKPAPQAEVAPELEPAPQAGAVAEPESMPEPEAVAEPEVARESQPVSELEIALESQSVSELESAPQAGIVAESESTLEPEVAPQAGVVSELESAPQTEVVAESESTPEPEVAREPGVAPQAEVSPQTELVERVEVVEGPAAVPAEMADEAPAEVIPAGTAAEEFEVKGSSKSMIFHTPDSPYFKRMKGDVTFRSIAEAERAGYTRWTPKTKAAASSH